MTDRPSLAALAGRFVPIAGRGLPVHNILISCGGGILEAEGCSFDYHGRLYPSGDCAVPCVGPLECAGPGTIHQGLLTGPETWGPEGNPHWVVGDVYVAASGRLRLEPGCVVVMTAGN